MTRSAHAASFLAAGVLALGACSSNVRPTAPTSAPAPPRAPVNGDISIASIVPASGSTLKVFDCDPALPVIWTRPAHAIGTCTDKLFIEFDVVVDTLMIDAILDVDFRNGAERCAVTGGGRMQLTAGTPVRVETYTVVLSDDPRIPRSCPLPVTTTRVVAELRRGGQVDGGAAVLTREFPYSYPFTVQ
jgi:hypothetical protein